MNLKKTYLKYLNIIIATSIIGINTSYIASNKIANNTLIKTPKTTIITNTDTSHTNKIIRLYFKDIPEKHNITKDDYWYHPININSHLKNSTENIIPNIKYNPIITNIDATDTTINNFAKVSNGKFIDNEYFKSLREKEAIEQIQKYAITTNTIITIINKTFQKAIIAQIEANAKKPLIKIILETDCSTAKEKGNKLNSGDGKTPEGLFLMSKPVDSYNWTYNERLMYGPKFIRVKNAIGIHGTGTYNINNKITLNDKKYAKPEQLGIYNNNFGIGLSHGCIRFENSVLDSLIKKKLFKQDNPVIIFENNKLTELLSKYYNQNKYAKTENLKGDIYATTKNKFY